MNIFPQLRFFLPFLCLLSCSGPNTNAQKHEYQQVGETQAVEAAKQIWVDSVYNSLNRKQRIGQLFMVAAYSGGKNYNETLIHNLIKNHHIGGLIFMQGTAENQAQQTNEYQAESKVPLLLGMDAEWGVGMRLTGVSNFPRQMMLGASRNYDLVYEMGKLIADQCKLLGVHFNFAPVVDVNNNPRNPVINFRSFGENKEWVSKLGLAYMRGMQDNGVLACAKHFPGHGDVSTDSHLDMPVIKKSKTEMEGLELYPFQQLIDSGIASVMVAHLAVPNLDPTPKLPTTLSSKVITDLLKNKMHFKGLIFTDALNMNGVAKYYSVGDVDLKAFEAGNDVLLFSQNVPVAIQKIEQAMNSGKITEERLEHSVKKILAAKYTVGLNKKSKLATTGLTSKLNADINSFTQKAAKASITLAKDGNNIIEKLKNKQPKIAYLNVNGNGTSFYNQLKKEIPGLVSITTSTVFSNYDLVILGVENISMYPGSSALYGINSNSKTQLANAAKANNTMIVLFGNAYAAKNFCNANSYIVAYEDNAYTRAAAVDMLMGRLKTTSKLPVSVCN